jgi:chromosome segregation ATPase
MTALTKDITTWLESTHAHLDHLDAALHAHAQAARRVASAREALEETIAELYAEGAIEGKNKEERDARLRRLTAAERFELHEAEDTLQHASETLERARLRVSRDRQTRYALQMRVALETSLPLEPVGPSTRNTIPMAIPVFDLERAG